MQVAIKTAEANDRYTRYRHGAVIVKGNRIKSIGMSKLNTDPRLVDCSIPDHRDRISTHAEVDAIKRCGETKGATLYVARVGRNGKVALSRPCSRCQEAIAEAGIKRVVYTVSDIEWDYMPKDSYG